MNIKILNIAILLFPLLLSQGCINPQEALDLVGTLSDVKPSNDWADRLGRSEKILKNKYGLKMNRIPPEGNLQSYDIKIPRDVNLNEVITDLEYYQVELDRFLSYYSDDISNIPNRAEYEKKLEAINHFLDNYDRTDKYFISLPFSHD